MNWTKAKTLILEMTLLEHEYRSQDSTPYQVVMKQFENSIGGYENLKPTY